MNTQFDNYAGKYQAAVQSSIDFAGMPHDFYLQAKALLLKDVLTETFGIAQPAMCLDVGCGIGALHPHIAPMFARLVGVDVSVDSVELASAANPAQSYHAYDGLNLPFGDESFDVSLTVCVMHHVPPNRWSGFLSEMCRVVRPGGLVVVIEHNPFNPATRLAVRRCEFDRDAVLLRPGRSKTLLRNAGLIATQVRHFLLLPSFKPAIRRCEALFSRLPLGAQYLAMGIKPPVRVLA